MKKILFFLTLFLLSAGMSFAQNEAKIGTTEYPTLEEAIAAATSGDVVEIIVANCGITNTTVIPAGITIKGLGKTSTTMLIESTSGSGMTLNNANVTLRDMTIDGSLITSGGYKTLVNVRADGCLITDVVMTGGGYSTWNSSILVETLPSTATFTVSNSTISGSFRGVLRESCSANIVINNCDIDAVYPFNIDGGSGGTVTVTGGALHGWTSYGEVDQVTFTNVTFSKANSGYDNVAAFVNTTFDSCTMDANFDIYAQTTGFGFTLTDCKKNGVSVTNLNFTELFPNDPDVWNKCVTTINQVILVGSKAQLDAAAASVPATVNTQMTQSFAYDGNLSPAITTLSVKGGDSGNNKITFTNCTATNGVLSVTGDLASFTCGGATINFENVAVLLGENASFTVNGQTDFFKPAQYYIIKETANGNGTYTYSTQYVGVATIGETGYPTLAAAVAAVHTGTPTTITILQNLNFYDIASSNLTNKTITFTGTATDTLTLTNSAHAQTAAHGADLTFENITLKNDNTADVYRGIIHVNKVTINNCEILGFMMGYANQFTCNNCTFTASCKFHMWTYGSNCTFNSCTFNSSYSSTGGKAINVYTDQSYDRRIITFNDCTFNATNHSGNGSAIQINSQFTCFVIYANNCTVSGYTNSESTAVPGYEDLANNKSTSVATTLYVDGVRLLNQGSCDPVAKIGETYYGTLQAAVDDARANMTGDVTIELLNNITGYSIVHQKAGLNITIEGNNDTIAGQIMVDGDGRADGTETLTIQNIAFNGNRSNFCKKNDGTDSTDAFILVPSTITSGWPYYTGKYNYAHNIEVKNCSFVSTSAALDVVGFKVPSGSGNYNTTINNVKGDNLHSLAQFTGTTGATVTNDTITNSQSFVGVNGGGGNFIISNCSYTRADTSDGYAVRENGSSSANITLTNNSFSANKVLVLGKGGTENPSGTINVESGNYNGIISKETQAGSTASFSFTGGTFNQAKDIVDSWCAPGYYAIENDPDTAHCTVYQMYSLIYNANGGTGTMDTIHVKVDASVSDRTKDVADCAFLPALTTEVFAIWNTKADSTGISFNPGDPIVLVSDTTLYAIWREGYTISYDANGGTGTIPSQNKVIGVDIILSDGTDGAGNYLITKTDSTLYRWNTTPDEAVGSTNYALGETYSTDAHLTLYAVWRLTLDMTMDSTDVVCYGENNGTDTVKIIGGEEPFQLVLSGAALTENDTVKNIMDRTYIFENLKPGSYTVTLTDVLGKDTIIGAFTIAQPDTLEITALTVPTNNPCPLMGVGSFDASVTAQGGNDPGNYTYAWGDDATNVNAAATEVPAKADDIDYTYTVSVTVTDVKACTATATATIEVSPVIVHIDSLHGNTTMKIDTIKQGIMQGCDTIIRDYGTPTFTFSDPEITEGILASVTNNVATAYPDSIFSIGYNPIIWTAVDTCGHEVTCEQIIYIYHYPCPSVDDAEGNTYNGVRVGCLCWTDRNMVSTKYSSNGNDIPNLMSYVSETFSDATENVAKFGYLYDWYAAADTVTNSIADIEATYAAGKHVQGVCPNGWYLPTDEDFKTLESIDAKDLRSTDLWLEGGGTNATGFNAVPGGFYNCSTGRFEDAAGNAYYWSCHPVYDKATGAMIDYICEKIYNSKDYSRCNGFSVRCVLIYGE